jgi:hypothetical protein
MFGMNALTYEQENDLLTSLLENLSYDGDFEEIVNETIDSEMPIYYTDLVQEWTQAGMPQPDDESGTIFDQMTMALWELYSSYAWNVVSEATDASSARELVQRELGTRRGYTNLAKAMLR